jgi:hypothetical protein
MRSDSVVRRALRLVAAMAISTAAIAQALSGFLPTKDYTLTVNGKPAAAEVYQQGDRPAVLVVSSALPHPIMLDVRTGQVDTVNASKIEKQRDGSVDLVAGALGSIIANFTMAREGVTFTVQGRKVVLVHASATTQGAPSK